MIWIVLAIAVAFLAAGIAWILTRNGDPEGARQRYLAKVRDQIDREKQIRKGKP